MAEFTTVGIAIDGVLIKQFYSLTLSQSIFEHHVFRIVCPAEAIEGNAGGLFNSSKNLVGGKFSLQIETVGSPGTLEFFGLVTQVETSRQTGQSEDVIISGYSPTILMDSGPHCKTWEKKAIKNIANDVLKHFPKNMLDPRVMPASGETLSYTVQYKESAWQFLSRLSSTHGEWFFYDGTQLVLGPPQGKSASLLYGSNLPQFNMTLQVRPASFQLMAYDYMNSEVYDGVPVSIAGKAGLNELGKHALQRSEQLYAAHPKQWHNHFLTNKKQLDDFINTRASMQSSNMVRFNGSSVHPGVRVGGTVSVQGRSRASQVTETYGDYTVVSVSHQCDGQGNYSNDFVAIPASVKMPPVNPFAEPHCETQSAFVTDNNDPQGLGRVRVKFHWMNGSEKSPWLRVTTPHAGGGKGMFIMPETGEEVIVGFEGDSATKPYVIGSVYHGKAKNAFANGGNDVKALQSRSGNKVVLNDKDGSVLVSDGKNNFIYFDGAGNISISSSASIVLSVGEKGATVLSMDKDGKIQLMGKDISIIGTNVTIVASAKVALGAGAAKGESFDGSGLNFDPNDVTIGAKKKLVVGGGEEANLMGKKVMVAAEADTVISGAKVNIN